MTTKKITSEDRKWALDNLGRAMKDLDNDSPEYDLGAIMSIKAALIHLTEEGKTERTPMKTYRVITISGSHKVEAKTYGQAERIIQQQTKEQVFSVVEIEALDAEYIPQVLEGGYEEVDGHD